MHITNLLSDVFQSSSRHGVERLTSFWEWLIRVRSDDPLRLALNRGFATVLVTSTVITLLISAWLIATAEFRPAAFCLVLVGFYAVAWWLNRRGSAHGAMLITLALIVITITLMDPAKYAAGAKPIPLVLLFPVMVATFFIRPRAGWWALSLLLAAIALRLALSPLTVEEVTRFAVIGTLVLSSVAVFLIVSASILWRSVLESVVANMSLRQEMIERNRAQERLSFLAHHDVLTGLPNRNLFNDRLQQALHEAHRHQRMVAILFLDLDHFKTINDSIGHAVGDLLLKKVGERLGACLRAGDTVARLGGDEFAIALSGLQQINDVAHVTRNILDCFSADFEIAGHQLYVTASLGVTLYPHDGTDIDTLLQNADVAMYRCKERGRGTYQFYTAEMTAKAQERLHLERDLHRAVGTGEFILHYHPIVDLHSGEITAAEALLRWQHPDRGWLTPAKFMMAAEESGLIVPIGDWVMRTACAQGGALYTQGIPVRMIMNISARQFQQRNFVQMLTDVLTEHRLEPQFVALEITESTLMQREGDVEMLLTQLCDLGLRISVDDFGTGYSSLAYLKRFPISVLKIDHSFVRGIGHDANDEAIIEAVIAMTSAMNIEVIAEGVETEAQLAFLRDRGCTGAQGFYFSKPLPADEFTALIQTGKRWPA